MLGQREDFYQGKISMHTPPYPLAQPFHVAINIEQMTKLPKLVKQKQVIWSGLLCFNKKKNPRNIKILQTGSFFFLF